MFKIASWNVNSLKIRLEQVLDWLDLHDIDVLALQETKLVDDQFPLEPFISKGYHVVYTGQKTYNGVAIISRFPIHEIITDIPNMDDPARRVLAITTGDIRLVNLYVPNGSAVDSDKYYYKLGWLEKVTDFLERELSHYRDLAVVGDFNIAPEDRDVFDPQEWEGSVLVSPLERQAFQRILSIGLHDSFRLFSQGEEKFSWWDYRAACFRRNRGLRIDHILLSKSLSELCLSSSIDSVPRGSERPSDHAPVYIELKLAKN